MGALADRVMPFGRVSSRYPAPQVGSVLYLPGQPPGGSIIYDKSKPHDIDVGSAATDRAFTADFSYTYIELGNPANFTGIIDTIKIWANTNIAGLRVGTFYLVSGVAYYACRHSVAIGNVTAGSVQTFTGLNLQVVAGDFIGCYFTSGSIEVDLEGGTGTLYYEGEAIDPGDTADYTQLVTGDISLYAIGCTGIVAGNNGTIFGATWTRLPSGLWVNSFDGTDDVINCGATTTLNSLGTTGDYNFTVLCWTKWEGRTIVYPSLLNKQIAATELGIRILSNNSDTKLLARLSTGGVKYKDAEINVSQNVWHLVGCEYDGANTIALCDTNRVTGSAFVGAVDDHSAEEFCIGNNAAKGQDYLGKIALFRAFNRALTAGEIATIFNQERSLFGV